MIKTVKSLIVCAALFALWAVPGSAFQLFGDNSTPPGSQKAATFEIGDVAKSPANPTFELGSGGSIKPDANKGLNIWIPGLGVVGKMPKLDFGLEMLYGGQEQLEEAPSAAHELEELESDFAIKGTIKRKF